MLLETNPATRSLHHFWETKILEKFPTLDNSSVFLLLINYINKPPNKFYDTNAFKCYSNKLKRIKEDNPELLLSILKEVHPLISLSYRVLEEINNESIHDILLPDNEIDLLDFIDKKVHYNLLKLYETPFFHLGYIIAKYLWTKAGKQTDGLNLAQTVKELNVANFEISDDVYLHSVRNGIAHGKIIYSANKIVYEDKKGNQEEYAPRSIIKAFDKTLDITNAFFLALNIFYFENKSFLEDEGVTLPSSILLDELKIKANAPAWTIRSSLEQISSDGHRQLNLFIKNDYWDYQKVLWNSFYTAYWAERLTNSYDRIFISLQSKHASLSPHGWAAFDGVKLHDLRLKKMDIESYKGVLENEGIYFFPKIKFPRFMYKLGNFNEVVSILFPLHWANFINTINKKTFIVRDSLIHSKGNYAAIQTASVVITKELDGNINIEDLIRSRRKEIVSAVIHFSRRQSNLVSLARYQTVKYIKLSIYDSDKRLRQLHYSGLIPELVATIEVNTTSKLKSMDIMNGVAEQIGIYRIVWHQNWRGKLNL